MDPAVNRELRMSIVIPAFNEESCISRSLGKLQAFCLDLAWPMEIVVVDDGSSDGTAAAARAFVASSPVAIKVIQQPVNRGKGAAVKRGVLEASGDIIGYMDADLSYDLKALCVARELILNGSADLVIGDRTHPQSLSVRPYPWYRKLSGILFSVLIQIILFRDVFDTQCGFKCFSAGCARELFPVLTIAGFGFDAEMLFLAARRRKRIRKIPVTLNHSHDSSIRVVRDSTTMFLDLFRIRKNYRRGTYGPK
jgi:dolichyl-phosphate beta-glucosyltransferase